MEEEQVLAQLSSDQPDEIESALKNLQRYQYKNNGILVIKDLSKLKTGLLRIFENQKNYVDSKVMETLLNFLSSFLTNNYGNDYEVQLTSHILPNIIKCCLELTGSDLDIAKETLDVYTRTHRQLQTVLDYILTSILTQEDSGLIVKSIKLAAENIEYHPKIISADSRVFITFIEKMWDLRVHQDTAIASQARYIVMDFLKRFPATMKEIANEMESRENDELSKLIRLRNETLHYKKNRKRKTAKSNIKIDDEGSKNGSTPKDPQIDGKSTKICQIDFSPTKMLKKTSDAANFQFAVNNAIKMNLTKLDCEEESKEPSKLESLIVLSEDNKAFDIFPPNMIKELANENTANEEKWKLLEVATSFLKSTKRLNQKFSSSASFANFIIALLDELDDEWIPKVFNLLQILIDQKCVNNNGSLHHIYKSIVKHLGSKVLDVRQEAMRTFISIMKAIPNKEFLELSIQFLTSNNWRIREEILNLIIINTLNKIDSDFDYEGVIKAISKLVNDDNAKVRFVSRESLAILANKGDRETVLDLWGQLVVHNEYLKLNDRLWTETIMAFNEKNLMFEYPKQTSQPTQQRALEKSQIKIRHSPGSLHRNRKDNHRFSVRRNIIDELNPQDDDQSVDMLAQTLVKNKKDTMISFQKSDYTEAETLFTKTKSTQPRKIRLRNVVKVRSPHNISKGIESDGVAYISTHIKAHEYAFGC